MPRYIFTFIEIPEPIQEYITADNEADALEVLLEDWPDAVVQSVRVAEDVTKLVLSTINGAPEEGISESAIIAAITTGENPRYTIAEAIRSLYSSGILLRKNRTRNYFICAAGRERANAILGV